MSLTAGEFNTAISGIKFAVAQIVGVAYGPLAKGYVEIALGHPAMLTQLAAMGEKNESLNLRGEDFATLIKVATDIGIGVAVVGGAAISPAIAGLWVATSIGLAVYSNRFLVADLLDGLENFIKNSLVDSYNSISSIFGLPGSSRQNTSTFSDFVHRYFSSGLLWTQPRDPLILDLDNDGIELTPSNSVVLFDHNADGIKTGSQWAKSDDGILVRDLNGNGLIDSGRELFGDQTQISTVNAAGQTITTLAAHGFAALKALDKDAAGLSDGIFNASDVAYADLKVWRDLNQDGISQSNELLGLAESGVSAINLTQTATQVTQGKSTFTKTVSGIDANGNPVTTSTEQTVQNVNFTTNNFYRAFTDNPVVTAPAALVPEMHGSGQARDLRVAMSLRIGSQGSKFGKHQIRHSMLRQAARCRLNAEISAIVPTLGFIGSKNRGFDNCQAFELFGPRCY